MNEMSLFGGSVDKCYDVKKLETLKGKVKESRNDIMLEFGDGSSIGVSDVEGFFMQWKGQRFTAFSIQDLKKIASIVDNNSEVFAQPDGVKVLTAMYLSALLYMTEGVQERITKLVNRNNADFILEHTELFPATFVESIRAQGMLDCNVQHSLVHGAPLTDVLGDILKNIVVCVGERQVALLSFYISGIGIQFFMREGERSDSYYVKIPLIHGNTRQGLDTIPMGYLWFMLRNLWVSLLAAANIYVDTDGKFCTLNGEAINFELDRGDSNLNFASTDADIHRMITDIVVS